MGVDIGQHDIYQCIEMKRTTARPHRYLDILIIITCKHKKLKRITQAKTRAQNRWAVIKKNNHILKLKGYLSSVWISLNNQRSIRLWYCLSLSGVCGS